MDKTRQVRVAIYARVSTKSQDVETQLLAARAYVERRWLKPEVEIPIEYSDSAISGSIARRPGLDKLMQDAYLRKFNVLIVQRFDRFARSTRHLVTALEEFQKLGIDFVSINESIDTSTPMGKMVFTILGAVAELEREIIKERVNAGLDRARKQGKALGAPRKLFDRERARRLQDDGKSLRQIATALNVSKDTIRKALAILISDSGSTPPCSDPESLHPV